MNFCAFCSQNPISSNSPCSALWRPCISASSAHRAVRVASATFCFIVVGTSPPPSADPDAPAPAVPLLGVPLGPEGLVPLSSDMSFVSSAASAWKREVTDVVALHSDGVSVNEFVWASRAKKAADVLATRRCVA